MNNGEVPQYYIEDDHEAIISPEVFDMVQVEMKNRASLPTRYSGRKGFGSRIKCGDCGSYYGSKVWHSNDKYRKIMYRCNDKYLNGSKCSTPSYSEEDKIKAKYDAIENRIQEINARQALLDNFINELQNLDGPITEFDEVLFGVMVSELEAKNDNTIIFRFIDGTEIPIKVK